MIVLFTFLGVIFFGLILAIIGLNLEIDYYREALEKIADPRKRDHKEPDTYTELCCVMNIANEALKDEV